MMTSQHRQEALSLAYVTAVAGRAGVTFSLPSHDYGTDLWLHQVIETNGERRQTGQGFRIQLKSTTIATLEADAVVYDLDLRAYEMLRVGDDLYPVLLVVYVMPVNESSGWPRTKRGSNCGRVRIGCCCKASHRQPTRRLSGFESRERTNLQRRRWCR